VGPDLTPECQEAQIFRSWKQESEQVLGMETKAELEGLLQEDVSEVGATIHDKHEKASTLRAQREEVPIVSEKPEEGAPILQGSEGQAPGLSKFDKIFNEVLASLQKHENSDINNLEADLELFREREKHLHDAHMHHSAMQAVKAPHLNTDDAVATAEARHAARAARHAQMDAEQKRRVAAFEAQLSRKHEAHLNWEKQFEDKLADYDRELCADAQHAATPFCIQFLAFSRCFGPI